MISNKVLITPILYLCYSSLCVVRIIGNVLKCKVTWIILSHIQEYNLQITNTSENVFMSIVCISINDGSPYFVSIFLRLFSVDKFELGDSHNAKSVYVQGFCMLVLRYSDLFHIERAWLAARIYRIGNITIDCTEIQFRQSYINDAVREIRDEQTNILSRRRTFFTAIL